MDLDPSPAGLVLSAFKDRDIPAKRDEFQSAFHGPDRDANAKWVSEHLQGHTLLSKDELTLYTKLENAGSLSDVAHTLDIEATRPLLDEDLEDAIESLNTSTAALDQQTDVLMTQLETLSKQISPEDDRRASQNSDLALLHRKHGSRLQDVNAATSDITYELEESLKRETEKTSADGRKILALLTSKLKEDDRKLANMEDHASQIDSIGNDSLIMKKASQLSDVLAEYVAEELYHRLDRLYLASIQSDQTDPNEMPADGSEAVAALEGDLESLYQEVGVLAQMSTTQQFSKPISRGLHNHRSHQHAASHKALDFILNMVTEITSSTEHMAECLQNRQSFCETLKALATLYQTEIASQTLDPSERDTPRRRSMHPTLHSPQVKPPSHLPELPSLDNLLRRFGLSSKSVFQPDEPKSGASSLYEKTLQMQECLASLDIGSDSTLAPMLACADSANQRLSSALNTHSAFEATLSNTDLERRLSALERRLGVVRKGTENIDLDVLYQRDKDRGRFMDRWG
ncbi:hypothetical protein PHISP_01393 [Aspergillus sp. HF37]|nr:hypothetical protein PHISP_01393 [Aspergillus sp. HF37]